MVIIIIVDAVVVIGILAIGAVAIAIAIASLLIRFPVMVRGSRMPPSITNYHLQSVIIKGCTFYKQSSETIIDVCYC